MLLILQSRLTGQKTGVDVGTAGVLPVMRALENHIPVALASKEVLVMARRILQSENEKCISALVSNCRNSNSAYQPGEELVG